MAETPSFNYAPMFQMGEDKTEYYRLTDKFVSLGEFEGQPILKIEKEGITTLIHQAFKDVNFLLRRSHNEAVAKILHDPEASDNDKYVAVTMLRNAQISANRVLPICQDTGTAIIHGEKGQQVWTGFDDAEAISKGVYDTYTTEALRYSQNAPLTMYKEVNTRCNLPAQIDIEAVEGMEYNFLCVVKGGGSANKSYLFQKTKAILNPDALIPFLMQQIKDLGTAACPPYHIAIVIGGTSAEKTMLTVKLASTHFYDSLPTTGDETGRAFRDLELEEKLLEMTNNIGLGAQFGGKYLAHDIRVVRLPRHGASCPIGIGVSCSADRNVKCKITAEGLFIEKLDENPEELIPEEYKNEGSDTGVQIDLNKPMDEIRKELSKYPVSTRVSMTGKIIVARDIAHAKLKERLDRGEELPDYIKNHPVLYAGPAKTPAGYACGAMGPTTANRMDPYADPFMAAGGSHVMIAKGNRTQVVTDACKKHGGFYLGTIGGVAAALADSSIKSIKCIEYPELGMEAVYEIEVENFPAFILVDDKGNDFFTQLKPLK
ncbi:fumarate hydratase [Turicimonas muris]|uniref:Fumarate hydratase class I n=4 Tax=Turicimonas muris TaxID=1796652 RepID=A0A227KNN3_9BURK|nr:fumarate hydratase [Turicimonas muris]ANU65914.1 fumarate hydratase [Burkholderiales bacterium YL45]MBS4768254.1 fumarate hydratase [Burkholderiales bacterium]OXE49564.1 fumarate hydratase [Turicimonas muris]QQQ97074.1 fumarate hydratase [Turicimonas muris]